MNQTEVIADVVEREVESFDELDLSPVMRQAIKKAGFTEPSPIQAQLIPLALDGLDVIGQARTGTGKTAAFSIPILEQLDSLEECRDPQALIIVPTRELADQVGREAERLAHGVETEIAVLAGGKNITRQLRQLENGVQMVVGTPGRLHDHLQRKSLRTGRVWCVVLDEADRMLDIGFRPQIETNPAQVSTQSTDAVALGDFAAHRASACRIVHGRSGGDRLQQERDGG